MDNGCAVKGWSMIGSAFTNSQVAAFLAGFLFCGTFILFTRLGSKNTGAPNAPTIEGAPMEVTGMGHHRDAGGAAAKLLVVMLLVVIGYVAYQKFRPGQGTDPGNGPGVTSVVIDVKDTRHCASGTRTNTTCTVTLTSEPSSTADFDWVAQTSIGSVSPRSGQLAPGATSDQITIQVPWTADCPTEIDLVDVDHNVGIRLRVDSVNGVSC
jgi:hypothetical protein